VLARDKLTGGANTPNLDGMVQLSDAATNNLIMLNADPAMLATNKPWVVESSIDAYSQQNSVLTPFGPWRPVRTLTANDATPTVFGCGTFTTANSSPTTITDFDFVRTGLAIGEEFLLRIADANTTIQNGANIVTRSGANITAQGVYRFVDIGGVWREV
jgi:hypothetical protein